MSMSTSIHPNNHYSWSDETNDISIKLHESGKNAWLNVSINRDEVTIFVGNLDIAETDEFVDQMQEVIDGMTARNLIAKSEVNEDVATGHDDES